MKRLFSKKHIWLLYDTNNESSSTASLGITDYAQKELKSIVFVNLPDIGDELKIGERFGDIESIKTVSDLIAPLTGKVLKINEELVDDPSPINTAPYDNWLIEVYVTKLADDLMEEEEYQCMISQL